MFFIFSLLSYIYDIFLEQPTAFPAVLSCTLLSAQVASADRGKLYIECCASTLPVSRWQHFCAVHDFACSGCQPMSGIACAER